LYQQRDELIIAIRQVYRRRRFTEAALSGVSAGVVSKPPMTISGSRSIGEWSPLTGLATHPKWMRAWRI
jgi:Signal transduction histidine kinase involved in nitrogen fixation and metabolism regulation